MGIWKSLRTVRIMDWRQPPRQIRDLLMDYGHIESRDGSVWLTLHKSNLPSYFHGLNIVKEAKKWVMVITARGKAYLKLKKDKSRLPKALRSTS